MTQTSTDNLDNLDMDEVESAKTAPDPGIDVQTIEAPGFIIDTFTGKKWAVPTGEFDDQIKVHDSPYDIKKDPMFHYEAHTVNEVADMESQGFVKVTNREVGRETMLLPGEQPAQLSSYYTIGGDQVMMKIPKVLADRRYARLKQMCDIAVSATEPPPAETDGRDKDGRSANERIQSDKLADLEIEKRTTKDLQEAIRR
jgi:hypothetical protein